MKIRTKKHIRLKSKPRFNEGDWIDDYYRGREIPFSELKDYIGKLVVVDCSTQAHPWYKVARISEVKDGGKNSCDDYVCYTDGSRRGGGVGRISRDFLERTDYPYPAYIWELEEGGAESGTYKNSHQIAKRV